MLRRSAKTTISSQAGVKCQTPEQPTAANEHEHTMIRLTKTLCITSLPKAENLRDHETKSRSHRNPNEQIFNKGIIHFPARCSRYYSESVES
jgi:hypothetical protein